MIVDEDVITGNVAVFFFCFYLKCNLMLQERVPIFIIVWSLFFFFSVLFILVGIANDEYLYFIRAEDEIGK